jgi:putative transposase
MNIQTPFGSVDIDDTYQRGIETPGRFWICYQLAWTTARRRKIFNEDIQSTLKEIILSSAQRENWQVVSLTIQLDFVFVVVFAHPYVAPEQIVFAFRHAASLRALRSRFPSLPAMNTLWTRAFFASTRERVTFEHLQAFLDLQIPLRKSSPRR